MVADCKECGCYCTLCNTNSLDLHHDIEVLNASGKESRQQVASLKTEMKLTQEGLEENERRHQEELAKIAERYGRLENSHKRLEAINHNLEDKILMLVQEYDTEREATMSIHEAIHNKLKEADKRVESIVHEKDTLAAQCNVVVELLKKYQSNSQNLNSVLEVGEISREVSRLGRTIRAHKDRHPVLESTEYILPAPVSMPISTFPPCAAIFDHSPKQLRKRLLNKGTLPRNASDSRLANMAAHPTNLKLCSSCKDVRWTRDFCTQTNAESEALYSRHSANGSHRPRYDTHSQVFDV